MMRLTAGGMTLSVGAEAGLRRRALTLRGELFRGGDAASDEDDFDAGASHLLVEGTAGPLLAARLSLHADARAAGRGYAGQSYDLAPLAGLGGPLMELGRLCLVPGGGAGALRLALAGLTRLADLSAVQALFGCVSLWGSDPVAHQALAAALVPRHVPQGAARPAPGARPGLASQPLDRLAWGEPGALPPLLAAYLALGGWVGPDLVIDRGLGTCHLLTVVETARIPASRLAALRALAGGLGA